MKKNINNVKDNNYIDSFKEEITGWDIETFHKITSVQLTTHQKDVLTNPLKTHPAQKSVIALHWHPEFIPMDIIKQRIHNTFPAMEDRLIIPTQHNVIMTYEGYAGVEMDCFSKAFNLKVQLLLHFKEENVKNADTLKSMLKHTYRYRNGQLNEFIDTIINPAFDDRLQRAVKASNIDSDLVKIVQVNTNKLRKMIDQYENDITPEMFRNKLLINYFESLRDVYEDSQVDKMIVFLKNVKSVVKEMFSKDYFYRTSEIIEEVRALGGCIIIPHPEQFWPILLADYDVDGYEVWNPQSRRYTDFLINVVHRQNNSRKDKPLLITMGDDCHMGEKVKDPNKQSLEKASREVGVQPAWEDQAIQRSLDMENVNRQSVIREYKARLNNN